MFMMCDFDTAPLAVVAAKVAEMCAGGSRKSQSGRRHIAAIIVCTANKFVLVIFSPNCAVIAFFARMARRAEEILESIAAPKQSHVNDNSSKLAIATPKMIGTSVRYTGTGNTYAGSAPEAGEKLPHPPRNFGASILGGGCP